MLPLSQIQSSALLPWPHTDTWVAPPPERYVVYVLVHNHPCTWQVGKLRSCQCNLVPFTYHNNRVAMWYRPNARFRDGALGDWGPSTEERCPVMTRHNQKHHTLARWRDNTSQFFRDLGTFPAETTPSRYSSQYFAPTRSSRRCSVSVPMMASSTLSSSHAYSMAFWTSSTCKDSFAQLRYL